MICQPHQRRWRDLCVDEGLRDEWLERLNALTYWKPYSTCEGHFDRSGAGAGDHPRVWLLLDKKFNKTIADKWDANAEMFQRLREDCFPAKDTTSQLRFDRNDPLSGTTGSLHLDSRIKRLSRQISLEVHAWWESTALGLEKFDHKFGQMLQNGP
jgi:hypothetical protein